MAAPYMAAPCMAHTLFIRAIVFDLGGTLEDVRYDDASRTVAARGLGRLLVELGLDPRLSTAGLKRSVLSGMKAYQDWREGTELELPPERVWTEYIFAGHDLSAERLMAAAEELTFFYEAHFFTRTLRPEAPAALETLQKQGLPARRHFEHHQPPTGPG